MGVAIGHTGAAKHFFPFWGWGGGGLTVDSTLSKSSFFWKKKCSRELKPPNLLSSAISDPNPVTLMEGECFHSAFTIALL